MSTFNTTAWLLILAAIIASAHTTTGRERYGVIGYGVVMYNPACAFACLDTVNGWMLDCPDDDEYMDMEMDMAVDMHSTAPSPECRTTNDPFLQTLAWCTHTHCQGVRNSTLEQWWEVNVAGKDDNQPIPKYSFQEAVSRVVHNPPTAIVDAESTLNMTSLVDEVSWLGNYNGDHNFESMEVITETYGIVLISTCVAIPVVFSWLPLLPLPQTVMSKIYANIIDPPLFGSYHAAPVLGLGFVPTRGQALFIAYIWIINVILSAVGFVVVDPMSWYGSPQQQLIAYIGNRVGILSFVNLAIAVLFSSRNNVLLFFSNWSHSTFLLIHRWVAVICMLQACLHSAIYLQFYLDPLTGEGAYAEESVLPYWIWGIVGTLALVLLMPFSVLPLRQKLYEAFLASHVVLSILAMIGCLLHIYYRYELQWGYQTWVFVTIGIWTFDRFVARPLRLLRNGVKRAHVTVIDEDYLLLEIPAIGVRGQAYLYFPSLTWRFWENHPFSVAAASTGFLGPASPGLTSTTTHSDNAEGNSEKSQKDNFNALSSATTGRAQREPGIMILIRHRGGLTTQLLRHATRQNGIPVLVEGSYGPEMSLVKSPSPKHRLEYPNLIGVAGGVGITGVLPWLESRCHLLGFQGRTKLFWGLRTEPLVHSVREMVDDCRYEDSGKEYWGKTEVFISVGKRFDISAMLREELAGAHGGTLLVVCGPPGLADDVRRVAVQLGREGVIVRLVEDSFSW